MRVRSLLSVLGAATLFAGLTAFPANAGTGSSTWCSDGQGYREIPILTSPVTVGIEIEHPPGLQHQKIFLCYSSNAVGEPSTVAGGVITLDIWTGNGAAVLLGCGGDYTTGIGPNCSVPAGVTVNTGGVVSVSTPQSSICLVSLGSGCAAYVPGLKVTTGGGTEPIIRVHGPGLDVPVNLPVPSQCLAVVVTCP